MKKMMFFILIMLSPINALAQDDIITEMCGVKFGADKTTVKGILNS